MKFAEWHESSRTFARNGPEPCGDDALSQCCSSDAENLLDVQMLLSPIMNCKFRQYKAIDRDCEW